MAAVTRLGLYGGPRAPYVGFSAAISAALSGTVAAGASETAIVAGGETLILTLTADTWVASGATFNAQRQNIIDGIDDAQISAGLAVTDVVRTSDTVVTITMSPIPTYDITSDSVVEHTIPASALVTSSSALVAAPTFTITVEAATDPRLLGGGSGAKKYRKTRYPRRVFIDGKLYTVDSAAEERELLRAYRERLEIEANSLEAQDVPRETVKKARLKVIKAENRIAAVDDREQVWLERLRREDEEILLVYH